MECWSHLDPALWPIGENALPSLRVRIHPKHHGYSTQSHSALLSHETSLIAPRFFATPQTVARQAPGSMGFSRQEYWGGVPCPPPTFPRIFPTQGSNVHLLVSLPLVPLGKPSSDTNHPQIHTPSPALIYHLSCFIQR